MLGMVGRKIRKAYRGRQVPHGKQSVRKLMAHGTATNSIELSGDAKSFDRVARKWNVDYAFYKTGPDKYLLFFKAGQADAMTACFSEYSRKVLSKAKSNRVPSGNNCNRRQISFPKKSRSRKNVQRRWPMRTDKIRKYLIPNIPYLFILWAFLKLGTAYRLAAGNDFAHKLIGLGQTIGPAFADFAPGLAPLDWLVGIVGAVGFRLLIYFKSKNAKKFRRDAEYGSARWGTEKDIKPFVDPKFENNVILTGTEFLTMNTRPKIPANARNLNCCIIAHPAPAKPASGSRPSFYRLIPLMWWSIPKAVCWDRSELSCKNAGTKSRYSTA